MPTNMLRVSLCRIGPAAHAPSLSWHACLFSDDCCCLGAQCMQSSHSAEARRSCCSRQFNVCLRNKQWACTLNLWVKKISTPARVDQAQLSQPHGLVCDCGLGPRVKDVQFGRQQQACRWQFCMEAFVACRLSPSGCHCIELHTTLQWTCQKTSRAHHL